MKLSGSHTCDDGPFEAEEVFVSQMNMEKIYEELGLKIPILTQQTTLHSNVKKKGNYVRTIPLCWIIRACGLPGKALHTGIVLWYFSGLTKSLTVKLTRSRLKLLGIHRESGRRALRILEEAKLVEVERRGHNSPVVTIVMGAL